MYAELSIDHRILNFKGGNRKKALKHETRRAMAEEIVTEGEISIVRACRVLEVHRSGYYYKRKRDDSEVIEAIRGKAEFSKDGFWKIYCRLRNEGHQWNHKRVYRVYKLMNLNYRRAIKTQVTIKKERDIAHT